MSQREHYLLTDDQLIICDTELGIDLKLPFDLPRIPLDSSADGVVHEKDSKGNLLSTYLVDSGRRHGQCRTFSEEGHLRCEAFYLHGKLHGPSLSFGEEGTLLARTWYCDGKKWGKAQFYFPNGKLASVQRYNNGEWEGIQEYFYEDGGIKSTIPFCGGKLHGDVALFWESGRQKRLVSYADGVREGWDRLWNEKGILIDEGQYRAGKPVETHRHFYPDGKLKEEFFYHTPIRMDHRAWDQNGKLLFEGVFASDLSYTEKNYGQPQGVSVRRGVWDGNRIRWK